MQEPVLYEAVILSHHIFRHRKISLETRKAQLDRTMPVTRHGLAQPTARGGLAVSWRIQQPRLLIPEFNNSTIQEHGARQSEFPQKGHLKPKPLSHADVVFSSLPHEHSLQPYGFEMIVLSHRSCTQQNEPRVLRSISTHARVIRRETRRSQAEGMPSSWQTRVHETWQRAKLEWPSEYQDFGGIGST